jgi:Leucine-rich repeat (LRR) protein
MDDLIKLEPRNGIRKSLDENSNKVEEDKIKIIQDTNPNPNTKPKKKIKYVNYTNSLILHSNEIYSLQGVHNVLVNVLPDLEFSVMKNRTKMDLIQWLDLSFNKLEDIHPDILNLPFLKILYLHANYIKEIECMSPLSKCNTLINLTLHGNPIEHIKGYRLFIIEMVPCLEKLDFTLVSEKELDIIHFKGARFGEKRNKQGQVTEYPKLDDEILKRMKLPKEEQIIKKEEN